MFHQLHLKGYCYLLYYIFISFYCTLSYVTNSNISPDGTAFLLQNVKYVKKAARLSVLTLLYYTLRIFSSQAPSIFIR